MKRFILAGAVLVALLSAFVYARPASAKFSFEDPQACLNGKLLVIEPTTQPIDVWMNVAKNINLDLNVADCGGDPTQPAVDPSHIVRIGDKNAVQVLVKTKKWTDVLFQWNGNSVTKNSGADGLILVFSKVN